MSCLFKQLVFHHNNVYYRNVNSEKTYEKVLIQDTFKTICIIFLKSYILFKKHG